MRRERLLPHSEPLPQRIQTMRPRERHDLSRKVYEIPRDEEAEGAHDGRPQEPARRLVGLELIEQSPHRR